MDLSHIFVFLSVIVFVVYVYSSRVFKFANMGVDYLNRIANKEPEKLDSPEALLILRDRDLPNAKIFASQGEKIYGVLAAAVIINIINYIVYPYDYLLYSWMKYVLISAAIFSNIDVLIIVNILHKNKKMLSRVCNAYYDITMATAENAKIEKTMVYINDAFSELMNDINKIPKKDNNKDENDEK